MADLGAVAPARRSSATVVLYEGTPGVRLQSPGVTVEGTASADMAARARDHADRGATRIELCGGVSLADAAAVRQAVPEGVAVRLVRYTYDAIEAVHSFYREEIGGVAPPVAFIVQDDTAKPSVLDHPDGRFIRIRHPNALPGTVELLPPATFGLIELYGGLHTASAVQALMSSEGTPIGFVD